MSERRIDWPAVALYTVLGGVGLAFIGFVLWRLALAVDWMAAALLGFVIVFGLLMVSFDMRGERGAPPAGTGDAEPEAAPPKPAPPKRGRPRKAKPEDAALAAPAAEPPPAKPAREPAADDPPARGPRNRAGRAPIAEPPAKRRPRNRP
jgi:hypothetical protein